MPLSAIAHVDQRTVPLQIDHLGQFPSATFSFDVAPGYSLGAAVDAVKEAEDAAGMPPGITTAVRRLGAGLPVGAGQRSAADHRRH